MRLRASSLVSALSSRRRSYSSSIQRANALITATFVARSRSSGETRPNTPQGPGSAHQQRSPQHRSGGRAASAAQHSHSNSHSNVRPHELRQVEGYWRRGGRRGPALPAAAARRHAPRRLDDGRDHRLGRLVRDAHRARQVRRHASFEASKTARGGIDYSKWDAFDESDGEGEPNRYVEDDIDAEREQQWRAEAALSKPVPPPASKNTVVDATKDGGFATRNGRICAVWSQSAEDVIARFPVGASTRAHNVRCSLQYKDDACVLTVNELTAPLKHDVWCVDDPRPSFRLAPSHDEDALKDSF